MSLGRLLRRASSKASDLLTLTAGTGGSSSVLDGEIIYSKNNVCVHPPELLQGVGEHHPGYLCLYMEKDELLGTTLILAWVPNSRIQRQDEEALRYVTPEGSPVRKAPRKRGRPAPGPATGRPASPPEPLHSGCAQGLLGCAVGEGVRAGGPQQGDPRAGQQEPAGDREGPLCSPGLWGTGRSLRGRNFSGHTVGGWCCPECPSALLCRASRDIQPSLFLILDYQSGFLCMSSVSLNSARFSLDTCDNRMTCSTSSASSLDTSAQFQESNGQTQSTRWDEQQKVFALEQVCGVFRVDLGQMRSLRLFFSDEACTCGQLVVASRESQYKIFHFHHGGLDKLSEVFQQWKYCTETHLKDQQLADEKTCMQFSIRRPKLPSSETHPEENSHRRLDVSAWLHHLNGAGQVEEEYKLRKAIFFGGIDISIRGEVWPFLLHYYSYESTSEEREALRLQKRKEYFEIQEKRLSMSPDEQKDFWRQVQFTVDKDVVRTDRSNQFFRGEDNPNVETMRVSLSVLAAGFPCLCWQQGFPVCVVAPYMSPCLSEGEELPSRVPGVLRAARGRAEAGAVLQLYLRELLRLMHPRFHQHLRALGEDGLQMLFCHRWILLCFKREFPEAEALRMWEACWAHYQTDYFHLFICVAIVVIYGDDVIEQQLATSLLYQFHLLPRIPCSLHDLCKLCGTGMWDSGFIPAVECSGHHPESESCPYGGLVEESSPRAGSEGKKGLKTRDVFAFRK
ncbi:TBC16 protein, partial [Leiothrix lutea]|nr:TBC16 protein [Leiothrix lutea]